MVQLRSHAGWLIPLAILAAGAALVVAVLLLAQPDKEVAAAIVAAAATVLGTTLSVIVNRRFEKEKERDDATREKKIPIYEKFATFWFDFLMADKLGKRRASEHELQRFFVEFTKSLMFWGSDEVVRKWLEWRLMFVHPDAAPADSRAALYVFEELLIAMRRDCGYPDTALGRGDVLSLWVNDLPEARAALSRFSKDRGPAKRDHE